MLAECVPEHIGQPRSAQNNFADGPEERVPFIGTEVPSVAAAAVGQKAGGYQLLDFLMDGAGSQSCQAHQVSQVVFRGWIEVGASQDCGPGPGAEENRRLHDCMLARYDCMSIRYKPGPQFGEATRLVAGAAASAGPSSAGNSLTGWPDSCSRVPGPASAPHRPPVAGEPILVLSPQSLVLSVRAHPSGAAAGSTGRGIRRTPEPKWRSPYRSSGDRLTRSAARPARASTRSHSGGC